MVVCTSTNYQCILNNIFFHFVVSTCRYVSINTETEYYMVVFVKSFFLLLLKW